MLRYTKVGFVSFIQVVIMAQQPLPEARSQLLAKHSSEVEKADQGDPFQQLFINSKLEKIGSAPRYEYTAIAKVMEKKSKEGDLDAMYQLAILVSSDYPGSKKDLALRKAMMADAARLGQPEAMLEHADNLSKEAGQAEQAVDWWLKARRVLTERAEQSDQKAMSRLWYLHPPAAVMNHPSVIGLHLFDEGIKWQKRSAEAGNVEAMAGLGHELAREGGVQNLEQQKAMSLEGFEWLKKAAVKGSWEAMIDLGLVYYNGLPHEWRVEYYSKFGTHKAELEKAWYWWDKAIAISGEEKVHQIISPGGGDLPLRPGQTPKREVEAQDETHDPDPGLTTLESKEDQSSTTKKHKKKQPEAK